MTTDEKIRVLERMRELLADPDRVVLNPDSLFESADGSETFWLVEDAPSDCRMCFLGSVYFTVGSDEDGGDVREVIHPLEKALHRKGFYCYTSALKQGRAVEVVDAVLADLREEASA